MSHFPYLWVLLMWFIKVEVFEMKRAEMPRKVIYLSSTAACWKSIFIIPLRVIGLLRIKSKKSVRFWFVLSAAADLKLFGIFEVLKFFLENKIFGSFKGRPQLCFRFLTAVTGGSYKWEVLFLVKENWHKTLLSV